MHPSCNHIPQQYIK